MLDTLGILFSTIAVVYVIVRAAMFDRTQPWFEDERPSQTDPANAGRRQHLPGEAGRGASGFLEG